MRHGGPNQLRQIQPFNALTEAGIAAENYPLRLKSFQGYGRVTRQSHEKGSTVNIYSWSWAALRRPHFLVVSSKGSVDFSEIFKQYWPFLALVIWFGYKWWSARRVVAMLPSLRMSGATLVDVRSAAEFARGNAAGTINIPLPELGRRLGEIPKSKPVVLCCATGSRSGMAKLMLKKNGYKNVFNIGKWSNFSG